jgi:hypothetical protein
MSDEAAREQDLKLELLMLDIEMRRKQLFWETPRGILLVLATGAAIGGLLGFKLGSQPPQAIIVQFQQPLGVKLLP